MGDRSQVCIKGGKSKIYLYSHWGGNTIYKQVAQALKEVPGRHNDFEYLARAIFCRMIPPEAWYEETGFGIGTMQHGDIEHPVPVLDCNTQTVTWDKGSYGVEFEFKESPIPFNKFIELALGGHFEKL